MQSVLFQMVYNGLGYDSVAKQGRSSALGFLPTIAIGARKINVGKSEPWPFNFIAGSSFY